MSDKKTCPVCGGIDIVTSVGRRTLCFIEGLAVDYDATLDHCNTCSEEGDFDAVDDRKIEKAIYNTEAAFIERTLQGLISGYGNLGNVARVLGVAQRDLSGMLIQHTKTDFALMRILYNYDWLIEDLDT